MKISLSIRVGYLKKRIIDLLKVELKPDEIKLLPGGIKHIRKKRPDCFNKYLNRIPDIINKPDYIGTNPKYLNSVEFIKKMEENILIAVRLHTDKSTLCVATIYPVTNAKINRMLINKRIFELQY